MIEESKSIRVETCNTVSGDGAAAKSKDAQIDNARLGYDAAIKLIDKETRTIWTFFGGMVATNSVLIGLLIASYSPLLGIAKSTPSILPILSFIGLAVCLAWFLLMTRTRAFFDYYTACAYEFEGRAFNEDVRIIRDAELVAIGKTASIPKRTHFVNPRTGTLEETSELFRLKGMANLIKGKSAIYISIGLFCAIYAGAGMLYILPSEVVAPPPKTTDKSIDMDWQSNTVSKLLGPGEALSVVADCRHPKKVISGGFLSDNSPDRFRVTGNYPLPNYQSWRANVRNISANASQVALTVFVSCGNV